MAKGDICRVEHCNRLITENRTICSACKQHYSKYGNYERKEKPAVLPGYVKVCLKHGQLKPENCLVRIKSRAIIYKSSEQKLYNCKQCAHDRYYKWMKKHPDKRKEDYDLHKRKSNYRAKFYETRLKKLYGMTLDDYERKFDAQKGLCAICGKHETKIDRRYNQVIRLAVDHCHKTGKIRDLLCSRCNTRAGSSDDEIILLKATIEYIERHSHDR